MSQGTVFFVIWLIQLLKEQSTRGVQHTFQPNIRHHTDMWIQIRISVWMQTMWTQLKWFCTPYMDQAVDVMTVFYQPTQLMQYLVTSYHFLSLLLLLLTLAHLKNASSIGNYSSITNSLLWSLPSYWFSASIKSKNQGWPLKQRYKPNAPKLYWSGLLFGPFNCRYSQDNHCSTWPVLYLVEIHLYLCSGFTDLYQSKTQQLCLSADS